jgi:hypothetical protein
MLNTTSYAYQGRFNTPNNTDSSNNQGLANNILTGQQTNRLLSLIKI